MTRVNPRLLIALAIASGGAACADNTNQIYIVQNQAFEDDECLVSGDLDHVHQGHGTVDVTNEFGVGGGYVLTPVVASRLSTGANGQEKLVTLKGARIQLLPVNSDASRELIASLASQDLNRQEQRFAASIMPEGSVGLAFDAIDQTQANALSNLVAVAEPVEVIARVVVFGEVEGSSLETPEWDYPITVCNGCRVFNVGACAALEDNFLGRMGGVCGFRTDPIYECCTADTGDQVCPAQKPPEPAGL